VIGIDFIQGFKMKAQICFLGCYLLLQKDSNNKALKREWLMSHSQVVMQEVLSNFTCYNAFNNSDGDYNPNICLLRIGISRNSKQIPLKCELDMLSRQWNLVGAQFLSETGAFF
jgi:hypothetical protein